MATEKKAQFPLDLGTAAGAGDTLVYDAVNNMWVPTAPGGLFPPAAHAADHEDGGGDEINVAGLSGVLADDQNPVDHHLDHENGGGDEISVAGLSGVLADDQNPVAHHLDHENGGGDEIDVGGLSGVLADAQNADQLQGNDVSATAPVDEDLLVYDAGTAEWEPAQFSTIAVRRMSQGVDWRDDFINGSATSGAIGDTGWESSLDGTAAAYYVTAGIADHPGIGWLYTGTDTDGFAAISTAGNQTKVIMGKDDAGYELCVRIPVLSTAAQEFNVRAGVGNTFVAMAAFTAGVWFEYNRIGSVNWYRCTVAGGAITATDTGVAVGTGWTRLRTIVGNGTVEFFINDVSVGSNAVAVPNSSALSPHLSIYKSAGTTARSVYIDYFHYYSTPMPCNVR